MQSSLLLTGLGLRAPHYADFLTKRPGVAWLEVHSENYFGEGGRDLHVLENIRCDYPISLHGVSLSLGSADELNWQQLKKLKDLSMRIDPCLISDHLSWSSLGGQYFHDLLPLPYTEEALNHIVQRIQQIQTYLNRQILIENIASYLRFPISTMTECEFIKEVAQRSGCGLLLDVNNVYVSGINLGYDPMTYIASIPADLIQEIHLAGLATTHVGNADVLIDSHDQFIHPAVWELYRQSITQLGHKPTIIEWDANLPPLDTLCLEAYRAEKIMREQYVATKLTD